MVATGHYQHERCVARSAASPGGMGMARYLPGVQELQMAMGIGQGLVVGWSHARPGGAVGQRLPAGGYKNRSRAKQDLYANRNVGCSALR